jgi:hypothetical protein
MRDALAASMDSVMSSLASSRKAIQRSRDVLNRLKARDDNERRWGQERNLVLP